MIVFISNYYNHHQAPFSQVMYRLTHGEYRFIATQEMEQERLDMGWRSENAPFVLQYREQPKDCQALIDTADVVIWGSAPYKLLKKRLREKKLTFAYTERIYKIPRPRWQLPLRKIKYGWKYRRHKRFYLLCASAYTAADYDKTDTFPERAYRWGYFPQVKTYPIEQLMARKQAKSKPLILWAGRLIERKYPEAALKVAELLKKDGLDFSLDIIGNGEKAPYLKQQIAALHLEDRVRLLGALPPQEVRLHMEQADIFLFTSDRGEGWGAVLNESMNSGCAVVASHAIGAVPFLLEHGKNGMIYEDGSTNSLCAGVKQLLLDPQIRRDLGTSAYETMLSLWNADTAAQRLLELIAHLSNWETGSPFSQGPCSPAPVLSDSWFPK